MTDRFERLVPPAVAPTAHLSDSQLAAVELSTTAAKHLADCAWCVSRRNTFSQEDRHDLAGLLAELDATPVPDGVLASAGSFAMSTELQKLLDADDGFAPALAPAQVWRLTWHGQDTLVVVLAHESWFVTVAPLSTDVNLADEYTAVCDAHATSLGVPTAVFMRATATVPQYTLARYLGDLHPYGVADPARELSRLHDAYLQSVTPPDSLDTGRRLAVDDWDRQEAIDALNEEMRWFESAKVDVLDFNGDIVDPNRTPGSRTEPEPEREILDVAAALNRSNASLSDLQQRTGIDFGRLLDLMQGGGKPTAQEARTLGEVLGVTVTGGYEDNARLALVMIASQPTHRALWHRPQPAASDVVEQESLRPFLVRCFTEKIAARTVTGADRGETGHSLEWWLGYWNDRLALHGR